MLLALGQVFLDLGQVLLVIGQVEFKDKCFFLFICQVLYLKDKCVSLRTSVLL